MRGAPRGGHEHEASRRLKTELFTQMDGIASEGNAGHVVVLASTNCPWDLDEALRRRLEKRILVPLPDARAREAMFRSFLQGVAVGAGVCVEHLAAATGGYSGADIKVICREAAMAPMRRLLSGCAGDPAEIQRMRAAGLLCAPAAEVEDFRAALDRTRPSVGRADSERYLEWERAFGSC